MSNDDDKTIKKATIRLPLVLHRWYRHLAVDEDANFEDTIVVALEDWARQRGYDPNAPIPSRLPTH